MDMDDDILLALRLQANDHGIFDEELIQSLCEEFMKNEHQDIDDMLSKTFKSDFTDDHFNIEFTIDADDDDETFISSVNELNTLIYTDECEIITSDQERMLRMQVISGMVNQNSPQSAIEYLTQMMSNGGSFAMNNPGSLFGAFGNMPNAQNPQNPQNPQNLQNMMPGSFFGNLFGGIGGMLNMVNMEPVQVTLTDDALEKLEILKYDQIKDKLPNLDINEQCSICLDKLDKDTDTSSYIILPCEHVFHDGCIKEWVKDYDYHCPVCKQECGEHEAKIDKN
jgi:Ring finger domain